MGSERRSKQEKPKKSSRRRSSSLSSSEDEGKSRKRQRKEEEEGERRNRKSDKKEKRKDKKSHSGVDREKKSKDKHKTKRHKGDHQLIGEIQELSNDDYFFKNNEFSTWLMEEKQVFFSDLSSESARKLFSDFVKVWNGKKLESRTTRGFQKGHVQPITGKSKSNEEDESTLSLLGINLFCCVYVMMLPVTTITF